MAAMIVGLLATLGACGGGQGPARAAWLGDIGDIHAAPEDAAPATDTDRGSDPGADLAAIPAVMTLDDAEVALARALRDSTPGAVVVYANRLATAGGALDARRRARVHAAVDAVPGASLRALWDQLDATAAPAAAVALRLAMWAAHVGDEEAALPWLARAEQAAAGDQAAVGERARAMRAAIQARRVVAPATIAVLLPLSGHFARLGDEMRAAIEQAAEADGEARLVFVDTGGDAARAVAAVDQAVHVHHAVAILGPVGTHESQAAAARAAELGVPIALLAPAAGPDSGADVAAGVFRLWPAATWEAREAARLAVDTGHTRLAVLAPRDEHGARAAQAFAEAAARLGAEVVARGSYDPTATDLAPDIKAFLGLDPAVNERLRRHLRRHGMRDGWKTFSPDVAFELLYIPDEHQRAALVASFLPYFNVEVRSEDFMDILYLRRKHRGRVPQVVQLLGSSGWHHPGLLPRGGPAVEGALVVDAFTGGADEDFASEDAAVFAARFRARTGRVPGTIAAQAHDAAALLLEARRRIGTAAPRRDLARELAAARLTAGACGPAHMERGALVREAVLLRVDGEAFVPHEL